MAVFFIISGFGGVVFVVALTFIIRERKRARKEGRLPQDSEFTVYCSLVGLAISIVSLVLQFSIPTVSSNIDPDSSSVITSTPTNNAITPMNTLTATSPPTTPKAGDVITFGTFNERALRWCVLEVTNGQALILSENVLEHRALSDTNTTWDNSSLRQYLAGDFYNKSFTDEERARILKTNIYTGQNPWYKAPYGVSTDDVVFLLSIEQVVEYFGDTSSLSNRKEKSRLVDDSYNSVRQAVDLANSQADWWLRTPDSENLSAAYVQADGAINVSGYGGAIDVRGVRPALWLSIN